MEVQRLLNKQKRRTWTNKQRWESRRTGNKARRRAYRKLLEQKKA